MHCLCVYLLSCRNNQGSDSFGNVLALKHLCGISQILDSAVCTRADNALVNLNLANLVNRSCVLGQMRKCNRHFKLAQIYIVYFFVFGVIIGFIGRVRTVYSVF